MTTTHPFLRPVEPEDEAFLQSLFNTVRGEALAGLPPEIRARLLDVQFQAMRHDYALRYPGADLSIIQCGKAPVGQRWVHWGANEVRLVDLSLLPERRGQGLGTALLLGLLDEAQATGRPLRLSVAEDNPALRLYLRLGFVVTARMSPYVSMEHRGDHVTTTRRTPPSTAT